MRESTIEKKICDYAKSKGCAVYKFVSPGRKGVPDRIIVAPQGRVLFLEVKALGKKPTALQLREMKKLTNHYMPATWVDSVDGGKAWVDHLLKLPA